MVAKALRQIITREPPVKQANVFEFPVYTHRNETFDAQREKVAEFIEAHVPRQ
jgi:hypothetical protein